VIAGRTYPLDAHGYLADVQRWTRDFALGLAREDGLELTPQHWQVIELVREYFFEYDMAPPMRLLTRAIAVKLGQNHASSRSLYRLFPEGPAKQACRYAGLPKPVSCI